MTMMTTTTRALLLVFALFFSLERAASCFFLPTNTTTYSLIRGNKHTRKTQHTREKERKRGEREREERVFAESEREYFCGCRCCSRISKHEQPPRGRFWGNATDEEHIFHQTRVHANEAGSPKSLTPSLDGDMGDRVFSRDASNRFRRRILRYYE